MKKTPWIKMVLLLGAVVAGPAQAQSDACVGLLQHGMYDTFRSNNVSASASQAQHQFCSTYQQYQRDVQSGNVQVSYSPFSGSASYSRDQMSQMGSAMCDSSYSSSDANAALATFSSTIDPAAVNAYRACTATAAHGLQASTQFDEDTGTGFSLSVSYSVPDGAIANVSFGGITTSSPKGITCQGDMLQLKAGDPFVAGHAYQLDCRRTIAKAPFTYQGRSVWALPYTVTVGTSAGSIVRTLNALPAGPASTPQLVPVGTIIAFSGTAADAQGQQQAGWWIADGRTVTDPGATAYYGKPTPDLRSRFIYGAAASGTTGGDTKITVPAQTINSHTTGGFGNPQVHSDPFTHMNGSHTWTTDSAIYSTGDFQATPVNLPLPPYYTAIYLIKVK